MRTCDTIFEMSMNRVWTRCWRFCFSICKYRNFKLMIRWLDKICRFYWIDFLHVFLCYNNPLEYQLVLLETFYLSSHQMITPTLLNYSFLSKMFLEERSRTMVYNAYTFCSTTGKSFFHFFVPRRIFLKQIIDSIKWTLRITWLNHF